MFKFLSRQIRQSGSFPTIVARTIEFSPFLIKFVKFVNYCEKQIYNIMTNIYIYIYIYIYMYVCMYVCIYIKYT